MAPLDLVPVWTVILAVGVFMYVLLDGFDLGVGILFAFTHDDDRRTLMMNTVAPIWDGNETWLVLGGTALLAAFPLAFAIIIPAVYFPIVLMLLGLIFRGVAFEFRLKKSSQPHWWDAAFFGGSTVATFFQGVVLGMYVQGFNVSGRVFAGTSFDWFAPFPLATGAGLLFGYTLLGATLFIISVRVSSSGASGARMPTPRSKPSSSTYMNTPAPRMTVQTGTRSICMPPRSAFGMRARQRARRAFVEIRFAQIDVRRRTGLRKPRHVEDSGAEYDQIDDDI